MGRTGAERIAGKVVAITGGARGIGRATAEALAGAGARVAVGDVDDALARSTADAIGRGTLGLALDVTKRASFAAFLDATEARLGALDVLVNNAGIMPLGPFLDEDDATARRLVDVNVHGVLIGMKLALPRMLARGRGHVVNVASMAGKGGFPGIATYCATKFAVVGVSEAVRNELRDTGVELSCVMPAIVNTDLTAGVGHARGVKNLEPEDVALAIVGAIAHPVFDVPVPRYLGPLERVMAVFGRGARERIGRLLGADRVMLDADRKARRAYEERIAHEGSRP
jgi:NADP-dependent 3-hydroxy acid dehydrogenase YdfG